MRIKKKMLNLRKRISLYIYNKERGPNFVRDEYNENIGTIYKGSMKESNIRSKEIL